MAAPPCAALTCCRRSIATLWISLFRALILAGNATVNLESHTCAGRLLNSSVVASRSNVTLAKPGRVWPHLQIGQIMAISLQSPVPTALEHSL
ncbi:MAG: hypothetical protein WBO88_15030 [Candidatus Dechloromonas phosphoritropha]